MHILSSSIENLSISVLSETNSLQQSESFFNQLSEWDNDNFNNENQTENVLDYNTEEDSELEDILVNDNELEEKSSSEEGM